ncbi:hypothetical protein CHS0354_039726 [Potamilus streckersoni]|uniref:Uncharacterized protein n=1 Tax=Potamilus streckersoni TaxID=2493646 RepID=A0AAE0SYU2_9BIVA|nr:hypothetical protein CHS0354_039726 [Potamilus streckersoni]
MDEKDRQILRQNRTYLVNNLHDIHNICEDLYSCDILTESMRSEIMAEKTVIKQSRRLLDILPKRGKQAFQCFLKTLVDNGQKELANRLDPSLVATLLSNDNTNTPTLIQQESIKQPPANEDSKGSSLITILAGEIQSVAGATGKETGFQAVHGPKGVQPEDVRGQKGICRQESGSQPLSIKGLVENLDIAFGSKDFSITPLDDTSLRNLSHSQKHYSMPHKTHRGRVLIINYTDFNNKLPKRPHQCNMSDSSRLIQMFDDLKFKVLSNKTDLDLKQTREVLEKEAKQDHSKFDCFILAILSHGIGSSIYTADGNLISIQEIAEIFNDTGAPSLKGKPKIFIIQAAEQTGMNRHDSVASDLVDLNDRLADLRIGCPVNANVTDTKQDVLDQPSSPDMLVVLGTAGYSSSHGSYFIQVLAHYICKLVYECHLEEIIKKVNSLDVEDKEKELCVYRSSLTKDFYFFTST